MGTHCSGNSCAHSSGSAYHQTIDELEFERGIWTAAIDGNLQKMQSIINRDACNVNKQDNNGYTALHYAARAGHTEACKLLISSGADINANLRSGDTALHRASYKGRNDVVELLISHRAEALQGADGQTPLHKAVEQKHFQVSKLLVESYPHLTSVQDNKHRKPSDLYNTGGENSDWEMLLSTG